MPYKLRKAPGRDLYWVVNKESGAKYSKDPIPRPKAEAQMKALYANTKELKGGAHWDQFLSDLEPEWSFRSSDPEAEQNNFEKLKIKVGRKTQTMDIHRRPGEAIETGYWMMNIFSDELRNINTTPELKDWVRTRLKKYVKWFYPITDTLYKEPPVKATRRREVSGKPLTTPEVIPLTYAHPTDVHPTEAVLDLLGQYGHIPRFTTNRSIIAYQSPVNGRIRSLSVPLRPPAEEIGDYDLGITNSLGQLLLEDSPTGSGKKNPPGDFAVSPTPSNPLSKTEYLAKVRAKAKAEGYPYKLLGYADDGDHKFQIPNEEGRIIRFGKAGYGDFLIWSALEKLGKVKPGYASQKRRVFHNSHSKIKGNWKEDFFSPNNLSLKILW